MLDPILKNQYLDPYDGICLNWGLWKEMETSEIDQPEIWDMEAT